MNKTIFILIACILIAGCQVKPEIKQQAEICKAPMIKIAGQCCIDKNNNSICDDIENQKEAIRKISESAKTENKTVKSSVKYINLTELEEGINKTYYPVKKYSFEDAKRYNLTDIENNFDIRSSDRFFILRIKKDYNYLNTEKNFTDFIKSLYDLDYKNNNIWARDTIDYRKLSDNKWDGVDYTYEPLLEKTSIRDKTAYFEKHLLIFGKNDKISSDISLDFKLNIWCTPELVVNLYPSESFNFYYQFDNTVKGTVDYINRLVNDEKKDMQIEAEKIIKVCEGNAEAYKMKPNELVFDEEGGFIPKKIEISKGGTVIIHNQVKRADGILFLFIDKNKGNSFTSNLIKKGRFQEIQINRTGNYTLFSEEYNYKAEVKVN